jgi:adenylate kinase family enzyme
MSYVISKEQSNILEHIRSGKNVVVDACAGSGKSTTILAIAEALPQYTFLQIAYNSALRHDFKKQVKERGLTNVKVHTFHSLAVKHYYRNANTDTGIRHILLNQLAPISPLPIFDVLVVDESQDTTLLYFQFIYKVAKDMVTEASKEWVVYFQLLILGDYMQGLYEFKGADIRFLTLAEKIWVQHPGLYRGTFIEDSEQSSFAQGSEQSSFAQGLDQSSFAQGSEQSSFAKCTLKTSYRITQPMADFVNNVMLGETRIVAVKPGDPVIYNRGSRANHEKYVVSQIRQLLQAGEKPDDIFVLGASVKGANSNIRRMENALVQCGIPCFVPMMEHDQVDDRVIAGKVVFSTFHTVKGRQRKYVFLLGFDNSYFTFFAKNLNPMVCPNTLYVACTRATTRLYILEIDNQATDKPLPFLKMSHQEMRCQKYIDFKGIPRSIFYDKSPDEDKIEIFTHYVTPTKLIEFVPESVLEEVTPILDRIFVKYTTDVSLDEVIDIPTVLETKAGFFEDVSDLNGIAIPCIYYDAILGQGGIDLRPQECDIPSSCLQEMVASLAKELKPNEHGFLKRFIRELPPVCTTAADYLLLANVFVSLQEKLYFKLKQIGIEEYQWITPATLEKARARLDQVIGVPTNPQVEYTMIHTKDDLAHSRIDQALLPHFGQEHVYRFTARVDLVTEETVWELKCTSQIKTDHLLQVVIYAWLWDLTQTVSKKMRIFNIKTGEILELKEAKEEWMQIVVALLRGKYEQSLPKTDEEFIESCLIE